MLRSHILAVLPQVNPNTEETVRALCPRQFVNTAGGIAPTNCESKHRLSPARQSQHLEYKLDLALSRGDSHRFNTNTEGGRAGNWAVLVALGSGTQTRPSLSVPLLVTGGQKGDRTALVCLRLSQSKHSSVPLLFPDKEAHCKQLVLAK